MGVFERIWFWTARTDRTLRQHRSSNPEVLHVYQGSDERGEDSLAAWDEAPTLPGAPRTATWSPPVYETAPSEPIEAVEDEDDEGLDFEIEADTEPYRRTPARFQIGPSTLQPIGDDYEQAETVAMEQGGGVELLLEAVLDDDDDLTDHLIEITDAS